MDNAMMAGGKSIIFKPILPPVLVPSETKIKDS